MSDCRSTVIVVRYADPPAFNHEFIFAATFLPATMMRQRITFCIEIALNVSRYRVSRQGRK